MNVAYISIGSNMDDPLMQVKHAINELKDSTQIELVTTSSFYQTEPVDYMAQNDFINVVVAVSTPLSPLMLLNLLQNIEKKLGKKRSNIRFGPRKIDLDILLYNEEHIKADSLIIPHPRMSERRFVLEPLLEIAPFLSEKYAKNLRVISGNARVERLENEGRMLGDLETRMKQHKQRLSGTTIADMFVLNPQRFTELSSKFENILYDYSKQLIDKKALEALCNWAEELQLRQGIADLFDGVHINTTENKPALHMRLRDPNPESDIAAVLQQMDDFVTQIHTGEKTGICGKSFTDIISIGIGGSELGAKMICQALVDYNKGLNIHFVSNIDISSVETLLGKLNPATTLCLVNSKSFTTAETSMNASLVMQWLEGEIGDNYMQHMVAITANAKEAYARGYSPDQVFLFWPWVGGRFSLWSSIGLPIALSVGMDNFKQLLSGAHAIDNHFATTDFANNIPVIMALVGIWNINIWKHQSLAVIPYTDSLRSFPAYLQQVAMESNGKSVDKSGMPVEQQTSAVVWGGVGCNSQHAFMQAIHQGTTIVPVDFIVAINTSATMNNHQQTLLANCVAQGLALAKGCDAKGETELLAAARSCPGNRPVSTLMLDEITPYNLGSLCAIYEHKVFAQGFLWNIQSFDQWGVELGKTIANNIVRNIEENDSSNCDVAVAGIIEYINAAKKS